VSQGKEAPDLTVLIPVYNEEENLVPLVEELVPILEGLGRSWEILFVDDGSTDRSYERLCELKGRYPRIRLVKFPRNFGKTAALAAGCDRARGEIIVTMDSDLQNDPRDIPKLIEQIPPCDLAIGYRVNRHDSLSRRVQSRIANWVRNLVIKDGIRDSGCGFQAFRRDAVRGHLLYNGLHRFLPALFLIDGYKVTQVPVNHRPRLHGKSKFNLRNRVFRAFDDMMAVRWIRTHKIRYEIEEER